MLLALGLIAGLVLVLWLTGDAATAPADGTAVETWLRRIVGWVALAAEAGAALIIGTAVVRALVHCAGLLTGRGRSDSDFNATETIRLRLGRLLVLGLEFTVAADILRTVVSPTREAIVTLTLLVLLRTFISTVLEREIRDVERRRAAQAAA